jgi:hypothetical protein
VAAKVVEPMLIVLLASAPKPRIWSVPSLRKFPPARLPCVPLITVRPEFPFVKDRSVPPLTRKDPFTAMSPVLFTA